MNPSVFYLQLCCAAVLNCSTILAKIRVVLVTRGVLLSDDDGGIDNTPINPFSPNFVKTFCKSSYERPLPAIFSAICCLIGNWSAFVGWNSLPLNV